MVYVIGIELAKGEVLQPVVNDRLINLQAFVHLGIKQKGVPAHFGYFLAHIILRVLDKAGDLSLGGIDAI